MEIRYQYNMDKLPTYYRPNPNIVFAKYGGHVTNDISKKNIA
jgi:hypothetical protein